MLPSRCTPSAACTTDGAALRACATRHGRRRHLDAHHVQCQGRALLALQARRCTRWRRRRRRRRRRGRRSCRRRRRRRRRRLEPTVLLGRRVRLGGADEPVDGAGRPRASRHASPREHRPAAARGRAGGLGDGGAARPAPRFRGRVVRQLRGARAQAVGRRRHAHAKLRSRCCIRALSAPLSKRLHRACACCCCRWTADEIGELDERQAASASAFLRRGFGRRASVAPKPGAEGGGGGGGGGGAAPAAAAGGSAAASGELEEEAAGGEEIYPQLGDVKTSWMDLCLWAVLANERSIAQLCWLKTAEPMRVAIWASHVAHATSLEQSIDSHREAWLDAAAEYEAAQRARCCQLPVCVQCSVHHPRAAASCAWRTGTSRGRRPCSTRRATSRPLRGSSPSWATRSTARCSTTPSPRSTSPTRGRAAASSPTPRACTRRSASSSATTPTRSPACRSPRRWRASCCTPRASACFPSSRCASARAARAAAPAGLPPTTRTTRPTTRTTSSTGPPPSTSCRPRSSSSPRASPAAPLCTSSTSRPSSSPRTTCSRSSTPASSRWGSAPSLTFPHRRSPSLAFSRLL